MSDIVQNLNKRKYDPIFSYAIIAEMRWGGPGGRGSGPGSGSEHSPAPTPSRAVYGFVLWLLSYTGLLLWVAWAALPDSALKWAGLAFLPQRYWAIALPGTAQKYLPADSCC